MKEKVIHDYTLQKGDRILYQNGKVYIIRDFVKLGPIVKRQQDKT